MDGPTLESVHQNWACSVADASAVDSISRYAGWEKMASSFRPAGGVICFIRGWKIKQVGFCWAWGCTKVGLVNQLPLERCCQPWSNETNHFSKLSKPLMNTDPHWHHQKTTPYPWVLILLGSKE